MRDAPLTPTPGAFAGEIPNLAALPIPALRRKRWIYVGLAGPRVIAGFAVVHLGYLGQAFGYAFDRERPDAPLASAEWIAPLGAGVRVEGGLADLRASARRADRRLEVRATAGALEVDVRLGALEGRFEVARAGTPISVVTPAPGGETTATIKLAGVAAAGELAIAGARVALDGHAGILDWTHAHFAYRTVWNWAAASGFDAAGRAVGFNMAAGVHDTAGHTENALWMDGRPAPLPPVHVAVGEGRTTWRIASADGDVALEFRPLGERAADIDYIAIASRFRQAFGTFHGRLRDRDGRDAVEIDGLPGVAEDHEARW